MNTPKLDNSNIVIFPMNDLENAEILPPDQNPAFVYLSSLPSISGRRSQAQIVKFLAAMLGGTPASVAWGNLRYQHTAALRTRLLESGYSPASIRKYFSAIRGILKHSRRLGLISAEDAMNASDLGKIEDTTLPSGRLITDDEILRLFQACSMDPSPAGIRDSAILALFCLIGPRRDEISTLAISDYDCSTGQVTFHHAKRRKERTAYISKSGQRAMADWLRIRGGMPGALFLAISKGENLRQNKPLSSQAIYNMIGKRIKQAGIEHLSPHDFRRTSISRHLSAGIDLPLVASIFGHSNVNTTARYDRRPEGQKAIAAAKLDIPYIGRKE